MKKLDLLRRKARPMAITGYTGTPLIKKLGIKPETKLLLINEPHDYISLMETDVSNQLCRKDQLPDLVHLFVKTFKEFEREMKNLKPVYQKNPALIIWVSWYKKSAKIPTDITEEVIRDHALQHGLVDVKVCAVNKAWSGLKLVVPLKNR